MLQPQLTSGTWHRWLLRSSLACGAVIAVIGATQVLAPTAAAPILVPTPMIIPSATIVEVPAPPAAEPAPDETAPEPPSDVAPPVVHTTCVSDIAAIGLPFTPPRAAGSADDPAAAAPAGGDALDAVATPDGCAIATWTGGQIHVTWDGGQTFATYDTDDIAAVAITADRLVVLDGNDRIGVTHPNGTFLWRELGDAATHADPKARLLAAGPWTVVIARRGNADDPADNPPATAAASFDDGASWSFIVPDSAFELTDLTPAGHLEAVHYRPDSVADGMHVPDDYTDRASLDLRHPDWHRTDSVFGHVVARGGWTYSTRGDKFWGCGASEKLVAQHGGTTVTLATGLDIWTNPVEMTPVRHDTAYAHWDDTWLHVTGSRTQPMPNGPAGARLVGIDGFDAAIVTGNAQLLRWSARGGWRVLYSAN